MSGWLNDPFFADNNDPFQHINEHFRQMEHMMNSMFVNDPFFSNGIIHSRNNYCNKRITAQRVQEVNDDEEAGYAEKPIIEEPDDENIHHRSSRQPNDGCFYYSSSTSYSNSNGVTHATRKTYNSSTGKTEMSEMKMLGDQGVARRREIDSYGNVNDSYDTRNLNNDEIEMFEERWNRNQRTGGSIRYSNHPRNHHHHIPQLE